MYSNNFDYSDLGWLVRSADNKNESNLNRRKFLESLYIEQKKVCFYDFTWFVKEVTKIK